MKENQYWHQISRSELPSVMPLSATAGYTCEMDLPPDVQIRLLAQEANFHCLADEALYVECLRSHGVEETSALDAYRFIQIALGRRLPAVKGVQFSNTFCRFDLEGRSVDVGCLSKHALFVEATKLACSLFTIRAAKVIGSSSPEVRAALAQMAHGVRPRNVNLRPCILFTVVPDPALVNRVKRHIDAYSGPGTHADHARPWWTRWNVDSLMESFPRMLRL
jgi:hypothetical protein